MDRAGAARARFAAAIRNRVRGEEGARDEHAALTKETVEGVPGAFLIKGAISPPACTDIMAALRDVVAEVISDREEKLAESSGGQNTAVSGRLGDRRASQHHTPVRVSVEDIAPFASVVRQYLPTSAGPKNTASVKIPYHSCLKNRR